MTETGRQQIVVVITTVALLVSGAGLALAGGAGGEPAPAVDAQISTHRAVETPPSAAASHIPAAQPESLVVAVPLDEEPTRAAPKVIKRQTAPPAEKTKTSRKERKDEKVVQDKKDDDDHETVKPDVRDEDDSDHDDEEEDKSDSDSESQKREEENLNR